jgi:serine protease Do
MYARGSTWKKLLLIGITALVLLPRAGRAARHETAVQEVEAARAALPTLGKGDTLSPLFHAVAQVVRPAVVEVKVTQRIQLVREPGSNLQDFLQHRFGDSGREPPKPAYEYIYGLGSGIIVDARNGYILTNWHVVHGAELVEVIVADGRRFKTQWVRTDRLTDLAVIKIDAPDLIAVPLGDSNRIVVGDWVLAIGAPEGLSQTVTAGIISAKGRTLGHDYESFLQTDAAINPGNSGGPLTSMKGEVIGINTAIVSPERINAGIGLAIPSNTAHYVMTQLIEKGRVIRGYVGIEVQDLSEPLARSFGLPTTKGALVTTVMPDGPAARAGIRPEDFITAIAGQPVDNSAAVRRAVIQLSPGTKVPFEVYRKGQKLALDVEVGTLPEKPGAAAPAVPAPAPGRFGLSVTTLTPDLAHKYGYPASVQGVLITAVQPGSEAAFAGLVPGMVILQVQGETVTSGQQAERILSSVQPSAGIRLLVTDPSGARIYAFVQAG